MSNEVIIKEQTEVNLSLEVNQMRDVCKKLLETPHYKKFGEEGIHAIVCRCKSMKIDPFLGLNSIFYVVQGRVGMYTEGMSALARQRGHSIKKDPKSNSEICILHGRRSDNGDTWTCSFSKDDAIAAGLWNSSTWKKWPGIMLYNRAMSMLFRQLFSDISLGAGYCPDEIDQITKTGDYAKSLPEAEYEVEKPAQIEEKKKKKEMDLTPINEEQVKCLKFFISDDGVYLKSVLDRLLTINPTLTSLELIPATIFEKVLDEAKKNFERREEETMMKQAVEE